MELPVANVTFSPSTQELFFHWFQPAKTVANIEVLIEGEWTHVMGPLPNKSNTVRGLNMAVALGGGGIIPQVARCIVEAIK